MLGLGAYGTPSLVFLPGFNPHPVPLSCPILLLLTLYPPPISLCPLQIGAMLHPLTSCPSITVFLGTDPRDIYLDATLSSPPLPVALQFALWSYSFLTLAPSQFPSLSPAPSVVLTSLIGPAPLCPSRLQASAAQLGACPARSPTPRPLGAPRSGWAGTNGGVAPAREGGRS